MSFTSVYLLPDDNLNLVLRLDGPRILCRIEPLPNHNVRVRLIRETDEFAGLAPDDKVRVIHELLEFFVETGRTPKPEIFRFIEDLSFQLPAQLVTCSTDSAGVRSIATINSKSLEFEEGDFNLLRRFVERIQETDCVSTGG